MNDLFPALSEGSVPLLPAQPLALDVAHELSNVLGCLTILPGIMQRQMPRDSALHRDLAELQRAVQRLGDLATQLSLLTGERSPEEKVDLALILRECLNAEPLAGMLSQNPALGVNLQVEENLPAVRGSLEWVPIIFRNLARAAIEAMPDGGRLTVSLSFRRLASDLPGLDRVPAGDYAVLSVGDTGQALSPEQCAMLFEPYLSPSLFPRSAVVRLGLMVVRRLVRRQKGVLSVRSGAEGTFFDTYFPVWRKGAAPTTFTTKTGTPRLMVVEDRQEQRDLFARLLEKAGYAVATAAGDSEALAALGHNPADLVLLDISLRKQRDGLDLYRRLRSQWPGQRILFMSGHDREEYAGMLPELLEARFLRKPFNGQTLLATVEACLAVPTEN